jgi:hypothetical protein
MAAPAPYRRDISQFIGVDKVWEFQILDENGNSCGDVTSWASSFMVKRKLSFADDQAAIYKTTGGDILPTADGRMLVTMHDTDTDPLAAGVYPYELKRRTEGFEAVLVYGELTLIRGVIRA